MHMELIWFVNVATLYYSMVRTYEKKTETMYIIIKKNKLIKQYKGCLILSFTLDPYEGSF